MLTHIDLCKGLNSSQKQAVETLQGPLLILAGAGSGKTRVLTHRFANLIMTQKAAPHEILAVTFTNKAAREMESRVYSLLNQMGLPLRQPLWITTFHSFAVKILRAHAELIGYEKTFVIFDDSDQMAAIKRSLIKLNIDEKIHPAKNFKFRIGHAKMLGISSTNLKKLSSLRMDDQTIKVYTQYDAELKAANAFDFDDLLMKTLEIFEMYPGLVAEYSQKFRYLMIDEYQDTNHVQYRLAMTLASEHRNLCVVGDEDQSIYSWRGADISNILSFEKDFPDGMTIKLEENYRSTQNIIQATSQLISKNKQRKPKTLFTNNPTGELIEVHAMNDDYEEARWVTKSILDQVQHGINYKDISVFYRTNAQSRVLEEALRARSIPYILVGGTRFFERMEIKDILAYLRLSLNSNDDYAFKRVVNSPTRGIGKTTIEKLEELATTRAISLFDAISISLTEKLFNSGTSSKLKKFAELISELKLDQKNLPFVDFLSVVMEKTEYYARLKAEDSLEAQARMQNLEELDNAVRQFSLERENAGLVEFMEEMALVSDIDSVPENGEAITLMTLHVSKGLEFPVVYMVGMEDGLFPSLRGQENSSDEDDLEEERRLCYVGMTRAREKLYLTYAKSRRLWGQQVFHQPSRFINELPQQCVKKPVLLSSFMDRHGSSNRTPAKESSFDDFQQDYYDDESSGFQRGSRVKHPTFGFGTIFQSEGSGETQKVSVIFADQTIKKFVMKYARLELVK